jgi:hypothetical protein
MTDGQTCINTHKIMFNAGSMHDLAPERSVVAEAARQPHVDLTSLHWNPEAIHWPLEIAELLRQLTRHRRMGALGGDELLVQLCDPQQPTWQARVVPPERHMARSILRQG